MAYSTQDILNQMATLSGQGLSNADVIAQLGTMGISPMQAVDAYSTRSDLFAQPDEIMQGASFGSPESTQAWVDKNAANPRYQARSQMLDYASQFMPPAPDLSATYFNPDGSGYQTSNTPPAPRAPDRVGGGFGGPGAFGQYGGYGAFGTQSNPWMSGVADDIMRRTNDALGQSFNGIRSNAVGVGGLGGSRQGVAEGVATRGAMDSMQGNLANLFGQDWTNTQNRGLQQYGIDTNAALGNQGQMLNYDLGLGGLQNQRYGMDQNYNLGLGSQALTNQGQQMSFYGQQRGQDLQQLGLGADLYSRGIGGEWAPIQNAGSAYSPFSGFGSTTSSGQQGGGWQGGIGGALAGGSLARQLSWW